MVSEKYGKIQKDYTILNPPLGKGNYIFFMKEII